MSEAQRFFFVHLHKTAGTSLWWRMSKQFADEDMSPGDGDGPAESRTISVDDLVERWPQRRDAVRVLAGHFPLCTAELLGDEFTTFTLLRDPVDRIVSALREQRQKVPQFATWSFEEVYRDPVRRRLLHNHMVKMFALTPDTMNEGVLTDVDFGVEHLERATAALETLDLVGFQDDVEGFCASLAERYDWTLGKPVNLNASAPAEVPASLLEHIAEDNALDVAFYERAIERFRPS